MEVKAMLVRVSGEFETADIAEIVSGRIKSGVKGIKRTGIVYNREATALDGIEHKTRYTLLPTAVTTQNYFTAVIESDISKSMIEEPKLRSNAYLYIICDAESANNVRSLMLSFGGMKVKVSDS